MGKRDAKGREFFVPRVEPSHLVLAIVSWLVPRYRDDMTRDTVNQICADLPGAKVSDLWGGGHDA
jgi:hypothetical protein